jgi:hypothetical protein
METTLALNIIDNTDAAGLALDRAAEKQTTVRDLSLDELQMVGGGSLVLIY